MRKLTYSLLLVGLVVGTLMAQPRKPSRPNIIFLLTDDHRWDALGVMGNPIIQTPNLDALARTGILFPNAYVTTSICCVSRASLLSGQYMSRHKIQDFDTPFSPAALAQTYPLLLKKAGYKIGFIGKYGVGTKHQPSDAFDYWSCTPKSQPDYEVPDAQGRLIHDTDTISHAIQKFLSEFANQGPSSQGPFCLSVGFKAPHELDGDPPTYVVQSRFKDLYANAKIPLPLTADPKYWDSFPDFFRTDQNIARVRWKPLLSTPDRHAETVKNYYRLITGVDEAVGKLVAQLKSLNLDQNTVIVFMGDNGFYLGEHGLEGKWYGHEESIRVPLIIYDPRLPVELRGSKSTQIALNIDVAPTLLARAGVPIPAGMQGTDLLRDLKNPTPERTDFFYEHTFMGSPRIPKVEGVVGTVFTYMNYIEHGYEELYNTVQDPHETMNLAKDTRYAKELENMRKRYAALKRAVQ
ncbi:sulfatase [Spirosoma sp. KNUC1025]|uniref:sulfatase family protein n=1 Tax=Spirosoma sp. KNUC1025 TaxID=2894082 RepID=UPI003867BDE0|nr:sulfatase [Spirosoma sp. KNUC1025]